MVLKPSYAYECAKEFTITAMQHSMITSCEDPKDTAKNVTEFFQAVLSSLIGDKSSKESDS